ncbi:unnamed protein product [Microthlaspi erraticum]|uniref:Aspartic peptidase DDI1-type domain-containing protein n=1 Tax=Microthlaspi erraticum TaxID=1685480 RepID=A0A6D2K8K9_9BRAS|nr:unnamed protein product [Microthlaspi erraticum]
MTLFPTKFENGKIEYKIRYKGRSRPFSRAKALVTSEQSRDPTKLKELLSQVLTITLDGSREPARPQLDRGKFLNFKFITVFLVKARFPIAPHGVNQPPSPPSSPPPSGMSIPYQERSLLSSISLSKLFQPACLSNKLGATTHSPPFFHNCKETPEDIKELFEKAKVQPTFKTLYKIEDPGQFSIPCQVNGHYFDRTLCDSGSCINLMPTQTAKLLGITRLQPAQISIGLANHTIAKPRGVVVDVLLEIGDIKIPVDFHVINIQGGCDTPLILGRPFLATAGAVMDLPNRRMSLANVDKTVFYKTIPFISPNKLSYLITAQGRPREPPDHTQGHNETRTKRLCLRPCPYPISN